LGHGRLSFRLGAGEAVAILVALVVGGMLASAVFALALHFPTFLAFLIGATAPYTARFVQEGGPQG
jgi:hypothetical protein